MHQPPNKPIPPRPIEFMSTRLLPDNELIKTVESKVYNCKTATLLCGDDYLANGTYHREEINKFLYKTKKGCFFFQIRKLDDENTQIRSIDLHEARLFFESVPVVQQRVPYKDAFGFEPEEA